MPHAPDIGSAFVALYDQLRAVARAKLAGTGSVSLQATALVHEALLKLSGCDPGSFADDRHFLATASLAIRHVIVDHLRHKLAAKRNGGETLSASDLPGELDEMLGLCDETRSDLALDLDQALDQVAEIDPEILVIVELHVYAGLTFPEIGALLDLSERTVRRRWQFAAALLREKLDGWDVNRLDSKPD